MLHRAWFIALLLIAVPSVAIAQDGAQLPSAVTGTVVDAASGVPLEGVEVRIGSIHVTTNEEGTFTLEPTQRLGHLQVVASGYIAQTVELRFDGPLHIALTSERPAAPVSLGGAEITVTAREDHEVDHTPTVSAYSITREDVSRTPGSLEDVTRALAIKPGVVALGEFSPVLYVRGGDVYQTYFFLDDVLIFNPFQPMGGGTVFNVDLLSEANLYTGGQLASFPEALAGVISIDYREPKNDRLHALVDLSAISLNTRVEGPLSDNASGLLSVRKSSYGTILKVMRAALKDQIGEEDIASPGFVDVFAKTSWHPTAVDQVTLNGMFVENALTDFTYADEERGFTDDFFFKDRQSLGWTKWNHTFGSRAVLSTTGAYVVDDLKTTSTGTDPLAVDVITDNYSLRSDLNVEVDSDSAFDTGVFVNRAHLVMRGQMGDWRRVQPGVAIGGDPNLPLTEISPEATFVVGAVYGQYKRTLGDFTVQPGVRISWNDATRETSVGPRVNAAYRLTENTSLKAAVGLFHQPPLNPVFLDDNFGNPELTSERAMHYVLGLQTRTPGGIWLSTEVFYKDVYDQVMPQDFTTINWNEPTVDDWKKLATPFLNAGSTQAYGAELSAEKEVTSVLRLEVNYSLLKVETLNPLIENPLNRSFAPYQDQRHTFNMVANYRRGPWMYSAINRFASGKPFTSIESWEMAQDVATDSGDRMIWVAGDIGPFNADRYPYYHRLDLRAERSFDVGAGWNLAGYIEVLGAQIRRNTEFVAYTAGDPTSDPQVMPSRKDVLGLPTIPYVGLRGEF